MMDDEEDDVASEEEEEEEEEDDGTRARKRFGVETDSHRFANSTTVNYKSKLSNYKIFFKHAYPECLLPNGELALPIDIEIMADFFNHVEVKYKLVTAANGKTSIVYKYMNDDQSKPVHNSYQHVSGHKHAIKAYYKKFDMVLDPKTDDMISERLKAYKRLVGSKKCKGEMKEKEGKDPLNMEGLKFLCKASMKSTGDYHLTVQVHAYLLFCWSLIARSETTGEVCLFVDMTLLICFLILYANL
jgi:hypothetical protein